MKILLISTNADEAGAPKHVETIVNGLKDNFEFILVFGDNGPVSDRLRDHGHIVHVIKEIRTEISPFRDLVALAKVLRLIFIYKPQIIHCHSAKAGMIGRMAALFSNKHWIYTVHGWGWRGLGKVKGIIITFTEKLLKHVPRGFYIYVAKDVLSDAVKVVGIKKNNGVVVYNGTPEVITSPRKINSPYTIMMPARVSSAKDHASLISAFELLNKDESCLILCGTGTDDVEFIKLAKTLAPKRFSQIAFIGQQSDINEIYSQCDVIALISKFEALPLSIIEAMSCNKAIIATEVGGLPELIDNGVNGTLVKPKSVDDIATALVKYSNPLNRIFDGNNARIAYENFFTEKSMLSSVSQIYRSHGNILK